MSAKKLDRALYGPSITEVAFGALLGLLVGIFVAAIFLVFKPVVTIKERPKEISRSTVYFTAGSDSSEKSSGWEAKRTQFLAGGSVSVSEDELNAWGANISMPEKETKQVAPAPKGKAATPPADPPFMVPSKLNFRVVGEKLQIGLTVTLNWAGFTDDLKAQATGTFHQSGEGVVFVPDTFFLGSCPLHMLPGASRLVFSQLLEKQKISDPLLQAWAKVSGVTIGDGQVRLAVQ